MGNSALNLRPDTPFAHTDSVGSLLQECRLRHGYDLRLIADDLNIRYPYLLAIEDGRYEDLPGPAYAAGFVRTYADYLGLPSEDVLRRFREEMQRQSGGATRLEFPATTGGGGIPAGAFLLVTLILAGCIYGVWFWLSSNNKTLADLVPTIPAVVTEWIADLTAGKPDQAAATSTPTGSTTGNGTETGAPAESPATQASSSQASSSQASSFQGSSSPQSSSQAVREITSPAETRGSDPLAALLDAPPAKPAPSPDAASEDSPPQNATQQDATQQNATQQGEIQQGAPQDTTPPSASHATVPVPEPPPPAAFRSASAEDGSRSPARQSTTQPPTTEAAGNEGASMNAGASSSGDSQAPSEPSDGSDAATDVPDETPLPDEITADDSPATDPSAGQMASAAASPANDPPPTAPPTSLESTVAATAETPDSTPSEPAAQGSPPNSGAVPAVPDVPTTNETTGTGNGTTGERAALVDEAPPPEEDTAKEEAQENEPAPAYVGQAAPADVQTATGPARIVFRAKSDAWIQLRKNGELVIRRLLRRGDVYAVPTDGGYVLNTSNAGGLEVYVDGRRVRDLGPMGARLNGISMSPGSLK